MKYFTKKLWIDIQNPKKYKKAKMRWETAIIEYRNQFEQLRLRLPSNVYKFFNEISLHDGNLISLELNDVNNSCGLDNKEIKQPVCISMKILGSEDDMFILDYKSVIKFNINYSSENPLFEYFSDSMGDIGYNELTKVNEDFLKHEFLFSTGSTIEVVFKEIDVKRLERKK